MSAEQLDLIKPLGTPAAGGPVPEPTRAEYIAKCRERWGGDALRDAIRNWNDWKELRAGLKEAMWTYSRNPGLQGVAGEFHNPDNTLTSFLWKLQEAWQPDKSCLHPLLDFEENFQKVFLRRGLIIYCSLLLKGVESKNL